MSLPQQPKKRRLGLVKADYHQQSLHSNARDSRRTTPPLPPKKRQASYSEPAVDAPPLGSSESSEGEESQPALISDHELEEFDLPNPKRTRTAGKFRQREAKPRDSFTGKCDGNELKDEKKGKEPSPFRDIKPFAQRQREKTYGGNKIRNIHASSAPVSSRRNGIKSAMDKPKSMETNDKNGFKKRDTSKAMAICRL